jgi:NADH-quinone oxidoreductase subunit H
VRDLLGPAWLPVWTLAKIVMILVPLILAVAYLTFWERKVIGWMQVRIGPNRVGVWGLLQPFADVLQARLQGDRRPDGREPLPVLHRADPRDRPAVAAWAVIPFNDTFVSPTSTRGCSTSSR